MLRQSPSDAAPSMIVAYETERQPAVDVMLSLLPALAWILLIAGALLGPAVLQSPSLGDDQVRFTIRVSLLYYFAATLGMLLTSRDEWTVAGSRVRLLRQIWTLACLAYVIHVALAFHHYHQWSHAQAMQHTRERSGYGGGIFASHLFTLLWSLDAAYWWARPSGHIRRPMWAGATLYGYMAFIVFCGTVVYESGLIRWASAGAFAMLAAALARRYLANRSSNLAASASRT